MLSHGIDIYSSTVLSISSIHLCVFLPHFDHPRHPKRPDPISSLEPSQTRRRRCCHSLTPRIQRKVTLVHSTRQWCNVVCLNLPSHLTWKRCSETIFIKETFITCNHYIKLNWKMLAHILGNETACPKQNLLLKWLKSTQKVPFVDTDVNKRQKTILS